MYRDPLAGPIEMLVLGLALLLWVRLLFGICFLLVLNQLKYYRIPPSFKSTDLSINLMTTGFVY